MRQRLTIALSLMIIIGALVVINAFTYIKEDKSRDFEAAPNRSTYHSGPTGTRALYDLLSESGNKVMRWREAPEKLLGEEGKKVSTFVVVGPTQLAFTEDDVRILKQWIARGGRYVIIDRRVDSEFLSKTGGWIVSVSPTTFPGLDIDPGDPKQMTEKVVAQQPVQPTPLTKNIQSVMPSQFASKIRVRYEAQKSAATEKESHPTSDDEDELTDEDFTEEDPNPLAPVIHIAERDGALLVDYSYGLGKVVILSDPYIVANGGIGLNDNVQLAINTIATYDGLIAFDEYHQGKGITSSPLAGYFSGTPVLAIAAQLAAIIALLVWSKGRRFARPLPLAQVDRRSSLEFVASMSELQERAKAYDLAIENIYSRTRRVLARQAGVDYNSPRSEIASRVASRSSIDEKELESLMRQCEETINGAPISWRDSIDLVKQLRNVEQSLGLRMRNRDARQAVENI